MRPGIGAGGYSTKHNLLTLLKDYKGLPDERRHEYDEFFNNNGVNAVLYTICKAIGIGLDMLTNENTARKNVGERFESIVGSVFKYLGIQSGPLNFKLDIPGTAESFNCEVDLVLSPYEKILSTPRNIRTDEILASIKTTSKDRMIKIFADKLLMEKFAGQNRPIKLIAIFLEDVQRKEKDRISGTFVANNYYTYYEHLAQLDGTYYINPPPHINKPGWRDKLNRFDQLILSDIWKLLYS